ncbi:MAG: NAD(P)H-dependent oxidoreductase [Gemmatimonadetes bacterium]|nr:NAD(P)H-dependent oxidoreductase [Gemmatimonadota bacterium]
MSATGGTLTIVGIPGSLRAGSYNRALLRAAAELAPSDLAIELFDIAEVPLYNADLDTDEARPASVRALKDAVDSADGVLLAAPEYNYGVAGVLKNALDWVSRPGFRSPFRDKPTGMMGAAPGLSGTMRGQEQLKLNLLGMAAAPFPHPGVVVPRCREKFDEDLRLTDDSVRDFLASYLEGFRDWVRRCGR